MARSHQLVTQAPGTLTERQSVAMRQTEDDARCENSLSLLELISAHVVEGTLTLGVSRHEISLPNQGPKWSGVKVEVATRGDT